MIELNEVELTDQDLENVVGGTACNIRHESDHDRRERERREEEERRRHRHHGHWNRWHHWNWDN